MQFGEEIPFDVAHTVGWHVHVGGVHGDGGGLLSVWGQGGFLGVAPCFDEDDKAIGCGDEETGTYKEPFVAAAHNAERDVDGVADEVAYPRVDVFAHHEIGGYSLKGEDGAVECG